MIRRVHDLACLLLGVLLSLWQNELLGGLVLLVCVPWDKVYAYTVGYLQEVFDARRDKKMQAEVVYGRGLR